MQESERNRMQIEETKLRTTMEVMIRLLDFLRIRLDLLLSCDRNMIKNKHG